MKHSAFEVATFIFSPIIGHYLKKIGRKNAILFGMGVMSISLALNGLVTIIEEDYLFFAANVAARFIQGFGDAFVQTSSKTVIVVKIL